MNLIQKEGEDQGAYGLTGAKAVLLLRPSALLPKLDPGKSWMVHIK
jgi:hypothetical protein